MTKRGFLGGKEAIESLRSSGYKDTSMAIGELVDNSIQAGAENITIVLTKDIHTGGKRNVPRPTAIAVIDDGNGMDEDTLQGSLVLGEGTNRYEKEGMGKFGVGLPQASISQARRIDVWSWQDSNESRHVYIDLNNEEWLNDAEIKDPDSRRIPERYDQFVSEHSGTIVEWSDTDCISWKKPSTMFEKCSVQIGRMYRKWLSDGSVRIRMVVMNPSGEIEQDDEFKAVDPLFLTENAECKDSPENPMFKPYGEPIVNRYRVPVNDMMKDVEVTVTFSLAKEEIRQSDDDGVAGNRPYGKLAKECWGVSIMREGRELELSQQWSINSPKDPRHRWWGAEISFNRDLDKAFGVTNNKQSATRLNYFAKKTYDEIMEELDVDPDLDEHRELERICEESPEDFIVADVVTLVQSNINNMYRTITSSSRRHKKKSAERHEETAVQERYDATVNERSETAMSETDELMEDHGDNRMPGVEASLESSGQYAESDIEQILNDVAEGHRCSIIESDMDSSAFFGVYREDTHMVVNLNTQHPMYNHLFGKFEKIFDKDNQDVEDVVINAKDAFDTVQYILAAWARMEDEERNPKQKRTFRSTREAWGRILEDSYKDDDE